MDPVWLERRKWPDRPHYRWQMQPLADDEHGSWFCMPSDALAFKGDVSFQTRIDGLRLVPHDAPWCAWFPTRAGSPHPPTQTWKLYVDIIDRPVRHSDGSVTMVDLDLDVVQFVDGRVEMLDEDEFIEHQVLYGYPPDIIEAALTASAQVFEAVQRNEPPFDGAAARIRAASIGITL
ncbi:MAG: YgaC family protein [Acidimicrobiia bacterium]|nr:YgaC family protein [Acidimicrobiia bacterium]